MTSTLEKWPILSLLKPEFISMIRMVLVFGKSGNSCLIETKDKIVYAFGNFLLSMAIVACPVKVHMLCGTNIKTFAYNNNQLVLALTENGELYSMENIFYADVIKMSIQQNGKEDETNFFVDIACGDYYYIALTNNGDVYYWHCEDIERNGQIVEVEQTNQLPIKFRSISCGSDYSVAVTCNGQVYCWEFGLEKAIKVEKLTGIVIEKVVCGRRHTLALSIEGFLYSWGDNSDGQLGINTKKSSLIPIPFSVKILDIAASISSNISVAVGMGQLIFMWGECLGDNIKVPTLISVDSIHDAFALYASPANMHQPFVIDDEKKKEEDDLDIDETMSIMDHLMAAFDDKNTSDLTIEVQGTPIYVHKAILKIRSKYFKTMFQGDWKENNDSVIREREFSYAAYRAFLKFLYTDEIDIRLPTENAVELLQLADLCNEDHLKKSYSDVLIGNISPANTAFFYSVAVQCNATELKERCIGFAAKHMAEVTKSTSFSELTKETMRNFIIDVIDHGASKISV